MGREAESVGHDGGVPSQPHEYAVDGPHRSDEDRANGQSANQRIRVGSQWAPHSALAIAGGYAYQNAYVSSATIAAAAGAQVGQVPHHMLSLWNNYQIHPRVSAALGILRRADMFATIDNSVRLPGYTRIDAAGFVNLTPQLRLQVNVENLFDRTYFINADSNTNISFCYPRAVRAGFTANF